MVSIYTAYVLQEATAPQDGLIVSVNQGELITLEVSGDSSSFSIQVEALADSQNTNFSSISGINLSNFAIIDAITAAGLYQFSVEGLSKIKISLKSISGGAVTVFSRLTKGV